MLIKSAIAHNIYAIRLDINEVIVNKLSNTKVSFPFISNIGQYDSNIKYYTDTFIGRVLIYNNEILYLLKDNIINVKK